MAGRISPYSYRAGNTLLHRCPALLKLILLFIVSLSAFFASLQGLIAAAVFVVIASWIARIGPWELMHGSRGLLIMAVLLIIIKSINLEEAPLFSRDGFISGCRFACAMLVSFSAAALFFSTSTIGEIRESLGHLERAILYPLVLLLKPIRAQWARDMQRTLMQPKLALGISLMLCFIPRFFEIWENTVLAYKARSGKKGFREITTLLPLVCERMIEAAAETADAIEMRNFFPEPGNGKRT